MSLKGSRSGSTSRNEQGGTEEIERERGNWRNECSKEQFMPPWYCCHEAEQWFFDEDKVLDVEDQKIFNHFLRINSTGNSDTGVSKDANLVKTPNYHFHRQNPQRLTLVDTTHGDHLAFKITMFTVQHVTDEDLLDIINDTSKDSDVNALNWTLQWKDCYVPTESCVMSPDPKFSPAPFHDNKPHDCLGLGLAKVSRADFHAAGFRNTGTMMDVICKVHDHNFRIEKFEKKENSNYDSMDTTATSVVSVLDSDQDEHEVSMPPSPFTNSGYLGDLGAMYRSPGSRRGSQSGSAKGGNRDKLMQIDETLPSHVSLRTLRDTFDRLPTNGTAKDQAGRAEALRNLEAGLPRRERSLSRPSSRPSSIAEGEEGRKEGEGSEDKKTQGATNRVTINNKVSIRNKVEVNNSVSIINIHVSPSPTPSPKPDPLDDTILRDFAAQTDRAFNNVHYPVTTGNNNSTKPTERNQAIRAVHPNRAKLPMKNLKIETTGLTGLRRDNSATNKFFVDESDRTYEKNKERKIPRRPVPSAIQKEEKDDKKEKGEQKGKGEQKEKEKVQGARSKGCFAKRWGKAVFKNFLVRKEAEDKKGRGECVRY